ncbi:MAG: LysR substrate-binding domain-containing protein, partial [Sciscionella sp.]
MTLTQLSAFVLVARLGSVQAAAHALSITEPAVSQALRSLRAHMSDQLIVRNGAEMTLTPGGTRLLPIASQMIALGVEAHSAVRAARGAPHQLRVVASSAMAEFALAPLIDTFSAVIGNSIEIDSGIVSGRDMPVLVASRLADVALGPRLAGPAARELDCAPIFRTQLVAVASAKAMPKGSPSRWPWLVDASGIDETSDTNALLRRLGVPEHRVRVFGSQTAAWESAAAGNGVAVATAHVVGGRLRRHELQLVPTTATPMYADWCVNTLTPDRRSAAASSIREFLGTPRAMQQMRAPGTGVAPSRFRPPV